MISFRLAADEFDRCRELCAARGISSVSEMARAGIRLILQHPDEIMQDPQAHRVAELENRIHALTGELQALRRENAKSKPPVSETFDHDGLEEHRRRADCGAESSFAGRVLLLITTLTFGGAETQVVHLAKELRKRGCVVSVVCLIKPNNWVEELRRDGIAVYSLNMRRGIADPRAIFRLRALIKNLQPDVVHSHMVHANLLGRITRLVCPMPVLVCTAHNLRETSEKGGATWHKEVLYRLTDFLADRTTIICKAAFARYVDRKAVPVSKLEVIPNGIDTGRFSPPSETARSSARAMRGIDDSEFIWLAVGRLVEQKDYPTLLRALQLIGRKDWRLLVAGSGPLLGDLNRECTRLGLADRVQFLGAKEDILDLYKAADGFVMSSTFEGLSAALLEASAMGLPSVVTAVGGNSEIVLDGTTGYVVPPSDSVALANGMEKLMRAEPEIRRQLGAAARQYCIGAYQFDGVLNKWLDLYSRCLSLRLAKSQERFEQVIRPEQRV